MSHQEGLVILPIRELIPPAGAIIIFALRTGTHGRYVYRRTVLSMEISGNSKLIVACSADKNSIIWGLDFGDCYKSLFTHDESVIPPVKFERNNTCDGDVEPSHYFWTVGTDKLLKD